ncbi:MAG TPA: serine protease [Kofleriaceae bacterium]
MQIFNALLTVLSLPVVGGHPVDPGQYPDTALVVAPQALCSGTLIAPDVVLTAGHCIETNPTFVRLNATDYESPTDDTEDIDIVSATAYPDWQDSYDVGVLVLAQKAKTTPRKLAPACAISKGLVDDAHLDVVGFGLTTKSGTGDNTLLNVGTMTVTDATCANTPDCQPSVAPDGEFVAGGMGVDACFGDSGGPVFLSTPAGDTLLGVVSRGLAEAADPCGDGGVFVRADKVISWIESTTKRTIHKGSCAGAADDPTDGAPLATEPPDGGGGCAAGGAPDLAAFAAFPGLAFMLRNARRRRRG